MKPKKLLVLRSESEVIQACSSLANRKRQPCACPLPGGYGEKYRKGDIVTLAGETLVCVQGTRKSRRLPAVVGRRKPKA